jgi:hypothetical protein
MRNDNLRSELSDVYRDYDFLRADFDEYIRTHPVALPDSGDAPPALRVERDATWEGGWVLHFPTESIAIATFEREQGRAALGSAPPSAPDGLRDSSDDQLLAAFVAGCNTENELNDAELSPANVRKGVAAAMRAARERVKVGLEVSRMTDEFKDYAVIPPLPLKYVYLELLCVLGYRGGNGFTVDSFPARRIENVHKMRVHDFDVDEVREMLSRHRATLEELPLSGESTDNSTDTKTLAPNADETMIAKSAVDKELPLLGSNQDSPDPESGKADDRGG